MALDSDNPFDQIGGEGEIKAPSMPAPVSAAPAQPAAAQDPAGQPAAAGAEANPFDAIGPAEVQAPQSGVAAFAKRAVLSVIPSAAGLAAVGPGAAGGAALGALGGPLSPVTVPVGGFLGGMGAMIGASMAAEKAQDYALSKAPDAWREATGTDEKSIQADEAQHPYATFLGGLAPYAVTMSPGGLTRSIAKLPENATAYQRLMANPMTARLFGGGVQGGMELGQERLQGDKTDWNKVAIATAFGTVFNKPTKLGEALHTWGGAFSPDAPAEAAPAGQQPEAVPTVAQAGDMKVMGPGITEDVFQGSHEMHPDAVMAAQEAARQEAAVMGAAPQPQVDLHDVARRLDPETFTRYDELAAQRDAFRKTIADSVNPPDDVLADAAATRDAAQADLDKIPASGAGSDKAELRRLRAQVRDAQRGVDALQARRDAFAAGTAMDTPDVAQARQHLMAVDYEMRDLSPSVAAAYRRAADHAASDTLEPSPLPAEPQAAPAGNAMVQMLADRGAETGGFGNQGNQVPPSENASGISAPRDDSTVNPPASGSAPGAPIPGLDIAADIARQLIAAGRPEDEARATGKLLAARYETRAARFKGALGTAEDVYRNTAPQMVGPDGRRIPGPPPRPADPLGATPKPEPVSPAPVAAEANPETGNPASAMPRTPRAQRKHASLLEFLAQSGGIAPSGETRALFDRKSPFLPGIGALVRKDGMSLDKALRAAEEAGYLHDPGLDGSGARTLTPNDLLDAMASEHGGTKIYRPGDEPPAPRLTRAEQRAETERHVVGELRGHGIDAADIDKPTLDAVVNRVHGGEEPDAHQAYEREVIQQSEQNEHVRDERHLETGDLPGWDIPADAVPASAASGSVAGRAGAAAAANRGPGAAGEASRAAGGLDRAAAERASHAEHERWLDSLAGHAHTLFQLKGDPSDSQRLLDEIERRISAYREPLDDGALNHGARGERSIVDEMNELLGRAPTGTKQAQPGIMAQMEALLGRKPAGAETGAHPDLIAAGEHVIRRVPKENGQARYDVHRMPDGGLDSVSPKDLGEMLGHMRLERRADGRWEVSLVRVDEDYRRQGIARKLYAAAADDMGIQMRPSGQLLPDGYAMWKARDPEAVKWHQDVGGDFLSPRKLLETAEDLGPEEGAEYREAFDALPPEAKTPEALATMFQGNGDIANGQIRLNPGRRSVITLFKTQNASTFIHESGHQFLEEMLADAAHPAAPDDIRTDAQTVRDWLGNDGGKIKTAQHERFARGFEAYMREGRAPSPELAGVFGQFRNWLVALYRNVKSLKVEINDDIRGVFDRLLSADPNRTVIAPERESGPGLGDIHRTDADEIEPHEADGGADRIEAEAARAVADAHPETAREIEAADARATAAREAQQQGADGGAGAQPAGQAGDQSGEPRSLVGDRGGPAVEPGRGGAGAPADDERGGGREAAAEGDGLRGGERIGAAAGDDGAWSGTDARLNPLAPGPAAGLRSEQSRFVDKAGNIRVDNLTSREDVAQAIHEAADANDGFIGQRRGVVTDGQVLDLADALGMTAEKLNARKIGQAFNAEQVVAARKLLIRSATQVADLMKTAAIGSDDDVLRYAEAKDRHQMIQAQVAGITAEAGRALRAFRDLKLSGEAQQADLFLRQATGKTLFQLKEEARAGAALQTPEQVSKFMNDARKPGFGRMLNEYFVNNLISGPVTHVTYGMGNTLLTANRMLLEQPAAAAMGAIRRAAGGEGGARFGEVIGQLHGAKAGFYPGVQAMLDAYRTGATTLLPGEGGTQQALPFQFNDLAQPAELNEHATLFSVVRGLRDGIVAAGGMVRAGASDLATGARNAPTLGLRYDPAGAIPDVQVRGVNVLPIGTVARLPSRNVAAIHSFFRSMNYSIDKSGQAYRIAANEGLDGDAFAARVGDVITNPDESVMEAARGSSTQLTLMGQGGQLINNLSKFLSTEINLPGLGPTQPLRFIDPFVKISGNVMNQAIMQRTPIGLFAPEMWADLAGRNGDAARDLAAGRMLVGSSLAITFGTLAAQGLITGSGPIGKDDQDTRNFQAMWRLAGNQPHSVRIGDTWYDMHRLGPLGMLMSISADLHDVAHNVGDGDLVTAAAALQHAFAQNILDESFMKGPADLIQAVEDPGRYGANYVRNFATSFVPYSVALAQLDRASDPYTRQARTIMDGIRAKVPGMSEGLFPKRDIWGAPMANKDSLISPYATAIYAQKADADPVSKAMLDIGFHPAPVERKIRGVDLTDGQFDDYARLAGGMFRQRAEAMVRLPEWPAMPDHTRRDIMEAQLKGTREAAAGMLMAKYPTIPATATAARRAKATGGPKPTGQVSPGS